MVSMVETRNLTALPKASNQQSRGSHVESKPGRCRLCERGSCGGVCTARCCAAHQHFDRAVCSPPMSYSARAVQHIALATNGCRGGHVAPGSPPYNDTISILALRWTLRLIQ